MTQYFVEFNNQTSKTWTMAVYQQLPDSVGLDSVSWKQTTVPPSGRSSVAWEVTYDVCLGDYEQNGGIGIYTSNQILPTTLGTAWKVGCQQLVPDPDTEVPANSIYISNDSNMLANPGIGMDGAAALYQRDVEGGARAQFEVTPVYYAGLFNRVILGEVIKLNVSVGPIHLTFPNGTNKATLTATTDNGVIKVDTEYSKRSTFSLDEVERAVQIQELRRLALPSPAHAELETTTSDNGA